MTKQSVLLLEAYGNSGEVLVDAILAEGFGVVVATHRALFEGYSERLRGKIDTTLFVDYASATIRADLVDAARPHPIAGVVTGWEFFTPLAAEVAADLALPGNDPDLGLAARHKWHMAKALHGAGVSHAVTVHGADLDALTRQIESNGLDYPVVVKPVENAGSIGVRVVEDPFELRPAVAEAQNWPLEFPHDVPLDTTVIAQSYVGGREYSVESLASDGEIRHVAVTEKATTQGAFRAETGHTVPAPLEEPGRGRILEETTKALRALGFRNGAAHTEVKLWNGRPWIIESGLRPAGDHIVKLVTLATGTDYPRAYVRAATGGGLPEVDAAQRHAGVRFVFPERAGKVAAVPAFEAGEGVVEGEILVSEGDAVGGAADNISRLAYVIATGSDRAELDGRLDAAVKSVQVDVE